MGMQRSVRGSSNLFHVAPRRLVKSTAHAHAKRLVSHGCNWEQQHRLHGSPNASQHKNNPAGSWFAQHRPSILAAKSKTCLTSCMQAVSDASATLASSEEFQSSTSPVVRVQCIRDKPRFDMPLLLGSVSTINRLGFVCIHKGRRYLLTAARSVTYTSQVKVYRAGHAKPYKAWVAHVGMECSLAILHVDDEAFWRGVVPLELGNLLQPNQRVQVPSLAPGQEQLWSISGLVSRVDIMPYPAVLRSFMGIEVDVLISKMQIGAPLLSAAGTCLGLVFQRTKRGSKAKHDRAFAAPPAIIQHFLNGIATAGKYMGFPSLGVRWKKLEALPLRNYVGLAPEQQGVLILDVNPTSSTAAVLQPDDVLMQLDDVPIRNDGTVMLSNGTAMLCVHYVAQRQPGSSMQLKVLRQGQVLGLQTKLDMPHLLLPTHLGSSRPSYFVFSGLVFTRCSVPYLESAFGRAWVRAAPVDLVKMFNTFPASHAHEVVVIAECELLKANEGYEASHLQHQRVVRVNGVDVTNLRQMAKLILECKDDTVELELGRGTVVVLPTAQARADTREMLTEYDVKLPVSDDLADLLHASGSAKIGRKAGRRAARDA